MFADLGVFLMAMAAVLAPLLLAWGIVSWQNQSKALINRRQS
jgi:hypothetical protein